jgi:hypothetical protein
MAGCSVHAGVRGNLLSGSGGYSAGTPYRCLGKSVITIPATAAIEAIAPATNMIQFIAQDALKANYEMQTLADIFKGFKDANPAQKVAKIHSATRQPSWLCCRIGSWLPTCQRPPLPSLFNPCI